MKTKYPLKCNSATYHSQLILKVHYTNHIFYINEIQVNHKRFFFVINKYDMIPFHHGFSIYTFSPYIKYSVYPKFIV